MRIQGKIREIESDRVLPNISTFSANSVSAALALHVCMFWGSAGAVLIDKICCSGPFAVIMTAIQPRAQCCVPLPHPGIFLVVVVVVMMMCAYGDSMTDLASVMSEWG